MTRNQKTEVELRLLEIIARHPEYSNKDVSNALKSQYLMRVDYRTVGKYRAEVEQLLKEIEAKVRASMEEKMKDENLLNSIWSRLLRKTKKVEEHAELST